MKKHTPGPWKQTVNSRYVWAAGDVPVAEINIELKGRFENQIEANARLIAAAPDMLDVLLRLKSDYEREKHYGRDVQYHSQMQAIWNVIAKATGQ